MGRTVSDNPEEEKSVPAKYLHVAILRSNTQAIQNQTIETRKGTINAQIQAADMAIQGVANDIPSTSPYGLFLAPEYFFAKPAAGGNHQVGEERHLSETDKRSLEAWMKQLSETYPRLIIAPGSIAWQKSLDRTETKQQYLQRKAPGETDEFTLLALENHFGRKKPRREKAVSALETVANQLSLNRDAKTPPVWRQVGAGTLFPSYLNDPSPSINEKIRDVKDDSLLSGSFQMARNTAYVYCNGKRLLKYAKIGDYHEVLTDSTVVAVPGIQAGTFIYDGVRYGLEICLDHYLGVLQKLKPPKPPHVHIILSAWVQRTDTNSLTTLAGFITHASSNDAQRGVFVSDFGPSRKVDPWQEDSNLAIYKIDLRLALDFDL